MTTRSHVPAVAVLILSLSLAADVTAQPPEADPEASPARTGGWMFTPSMTAGALWDDNVLIQGTADAPVTDQMTIVNPSGSIGYVGKQSELSATYNSSLTLYRSFTSLNSYEYTARVSARRRLTPHTTVSAYQSFSVAPTTAVQALVGVPFVRIGSRLAHLGAAIESEATRRTTIVAAYDLEVIRFDEDPVLGRPLVGGQSHKGRVGLRRRMGPRAAITADYDMVRATVASGDAFSVQNAWLGGDYRLTELVSVFGTAGLARLDTPDLQGTQVMPAWRTGVSRRFRTAEVEVLYGRTFVPSYGGGGTQANQEVVSSLLLPIGRRMHTNTAVAWRRDSAVLVDDALPLTSVWLSSVIGYAVRPWIRIEGFYGGLHQRIDRPGGRLDRNRMGIQVSTGTPMRIR